LKLRNFLVATLGHRESVTCVQKPERSVISPVLQTDSYGPMRSGACASMLQRFYKLVRANNAPGGQANACDSDAMRCICSDAGIFVQTKSNKLMLPKRRSCKSEHLVCVCVFDVRFTSVSTIVSLSIDSLYMVIPSVVKSPSDLRFGLAKRCSEIPCRENLLYSVWATNHVIRCDAVTFVQTSSVKCLLEISPDLQTDACAPMR